MLPLRVRRASGFEGRLNDALFQPAARPPPAAPAPPATPAPASPARPRTLVFFGGDVQDYPEVMQTHRDNRNYLKWNLENTARMLSHNFPDKHILVIRPSRIEYKSFSCYDNFVPSNNAGVPDHTPTHNALHHLERLLQSVSSRIKAMPTSELLEAVSSVSLPEEIDIEELHNASVHRTEQSKSNGSTKSDAAHHSGSDASAASEHKPQLHKFCESKISNGLLLWRQHNDLGELAASPRLQANFEKDDPLWWRDNLALDESYLTLVGFSKGCVVLNQFIYEFHYTKTLTPGDAHMMRFIERMEAMYWLDGGHAGGKNTWITARSLLETLTRLDVDIYIHVSPYQVKDESRPWIGREEKAFTSLLKKLGAKVRRYEHEVVATGGLHAHFSVLAQFKSVQERAPPRSPPPGDASDDDT